MSGSQPAAAHPPAPDPSMDDILASIRRILAEDENAGTSTAPVPDPDPVPHQAPSAVLILDESMIAEEAPPPAPEPLPAAMPPPAMHQPPQFQPAPVQAHPFEPPAAPPPVARPHEDALVAPEAAAASSASVSTLIRHLAQERSLTVTRGGPSLEDVIRDEMRPILKHWLDTNLPALVERLVRAEIARVVDRSVT